jgi:hypothetical protein
MGGFVVSNVCFSIIFSDFYLNAILNYSNVYSSAGYSISLTTLTSLVDYSLFLTANPTTFLAFLIYRRRFIFLPAARSLLL